MKTVGLVTIRLNSKRVPQKNIKLLGSKPLCWYVVNTLLQVNEIDSIYVYCSDPVIKHYIPEKALFLEREKWLDGDEIKAEDTYSAFIKEIEADVYVVASTTSPFLKAETVSFGLQKILKNEHDSAFTVKRAQTFAWYQGSPLNYNLEDIPRTQDIVPVLLETSAYYAFKREVWTKQGRRIGLNPCVVEVENIEAIDIDTPDDFEFAQLIMSANANQSVNGGYANV